jgi:hypothetical protein
MVKSLEDEVSEGVADVVIRYGMPESLAYLKLIEIKDYVKQSETGRSETYYTYMAIARLRNYARAYMKKGGEWK